MTHGVFVAVSISIVWILFQIGIMHIKPAQNRFRAMFLGYCVSLPFVFIAYRWLPLPLSITQTSSGESSLVGLFHAYFFHLLLYFFYVECFYHVERTVRLRILIEILKYPDECPPLEAIQKQYNLTDMITRRLDVLQDRGFLEFRDQKWHLRPKGRLFARLMGITSWVFQAPGFRDSHMPGEPPAKQNSP